MIQPGPDALDAYDGYGWYGPLVVFSRRCRDDDIPWPVFVDEFEFLGGLKRRSRPDLSIYRHSETGGLLILDRSGQAYRFIPNAKGPRPGRFLSSGGRRAIWTARLPDCLTVTYERRPTWPNHDGDDLGAASPFRSVDRGA